MRMKLKMWVGVKFLLEEYKVEKELCDKRFGLII